MVRCAIWYRLSNLKSLKNTHGGVLILVKLQAKVCSFTKINTSPWGFFTFFKLYKWCQIAQCITYGEKESRQSEGLQICSENQWTGFYMISASVMEELKNQNWFI